MTATRTDILTALSARLATVATTVDWQSIPVHPAALPLITWRDGVARKNRGIIGDDEYRLRIVVCAYCSGSTPAITARRILSDIIIASGMPDIHYLESVIDLQQRGNIIAGVRVALETVCIEAQPTIDVLIDEESNWLTDENGDTLTW